MKLFNSENTKKFSWICFLFLSVLYFLTMQNADILITYKHGLNLLDCIRTGNGFDFYQYTIDHTVGGWMADYLIPTYFVFALWNLPIWILDRFIWKQGWNMEIATGCLLWAKLMLVPFVLLFLNEIRKIAKKMDVSCVHGLLFALCTSLFFFIPVWGVAQYDVIELFFLFWGINTYLNEGKFGWKSILVFGISMGFKAIAFLPFVILVLLDEKRIAHILFKVISGLLVTVGIMLPFQNGFSVASEENSSGMIKRILELQFGADGHKTSVFALIVVAVCIIAFLTKKKNAKATILYWTWLTAFLWIGLFSFSDAQQHWSVMIIPSLLLLIFINEAFFRQNIILSIVMEIGYFAMRGNIYSSEIFDPGAFMWLILRTKPQTDGIINGIDIRNMILTSIDEYAPVFLAIFTVCGFTLLVCNNPWKKLPLEETSQEEFKTIELHSRYVRLLLILIYFLLTYCRSFLI